MWHLPTRLDSLWMGKLKLHYMWVVAFRTLNLKNKKKKETLIWRRITAPISALISLPLSHASLVPRLMPRTPPLTFFSVVCEIIRSGRIICKRFGEQKLHRMLPESLCFSQQQFLHYMWVVAFSQLEENKKDINLKKNDPDLSFYLLAALACFHCASSMSRLLLSLHFPSCVQNN